MQYKWNDAKRKTISLPTLDERFWLYFDRFVVQLIGVCALCMFTPV